MSHCIFCKIVGKEAPAHTVYEDDHVMAILDIGHVNPGHTIILSKNHVETLLDANEELVAHAFRVASRIAKGLDSALPSEGMTLLQANRPAGFQTVPHFHLHVLPRNAEDGVELVWPRKRPSQEQLAEYAATLREALSG